MKHSKHIFKLIVLLIFGNLLSIQLFAQSKASIENIDFYAEGSKLVITYDIVNAMADETFETWVKVITASGRQIIPATTYGDIGKGVTGGPNKRIEWEVETDNANLDEEFSVEVFARSDLQKKPKETGTQHFKTDKKGISVGGAMILSAILPGLGRTVAEGGGGQWVLGLVGYGCVVGSVMMKNSSVYSDSDYRLASYKEERDDLFEQGENQDLYSRVFIGGAAAIWVFDLIYTGAVAGRERKAKQKGFSLNYQFDPGSGAPMLGLNYRF